MGKWFFPLSPASGICAAPWIGQFTVTLSGDVFLCCLSSIILGNLHHSSLQEIWQGPRMTSIRKAFNRGYYPHECGYCRGFGIENYPHNAFMKMSRGRETTSY